MPLSPCYTSGSGPIRAILAHLPSTCIVGPGFQGANPCQASGGPGTLGLHLSRCITRRYVPATIALAIRKTSSGSSRRVRNFSRSSEFANRTRVADHWIRLPFGCPLFNSLRLPWAAPNHATGHKLSIAPSRYYRHVSNGLPQEYGCDRVPRFVTRPRPKARIGCAGGVRHFDTRLSGSGRLRLPRRRTTGLRRSTCMTRLDVQWVSPSGVRKSWRSNRCAMERHAVPF